METWSVTGIKLELREASERGRLYPRYAEQSDMLVIESRHRRDWPYGININGGAVILDLDADRLLANVDLMIPKGRWAVREPWPPPRSVKKADVAVSQTAIEEKEFDEWPLRVMTARDRSWFLIKFTEWESVEQGVELSESCLALVEGNDLVGFYGTLPAHSLWIQRGGP